LALYEQSIKELAGEMGAVFVRAEWQQSARIDLKEGTDNGIHLTERGYRALAEGVAAQLGWTVNARGWDAPDTATISLREAILRNALLADRLVGSFLDHVRSGELPLNETVDVAFVARSVAAQQQRAASELTVEAPTSLLVPSVSAALIERVIGNLLDNAFTHGQPPVRLTVAAVDHHVSIEVEDRGPGIAPEDQPAMLQAFARGDTSRGHPGLGLGLAIVQRVASRLGGSVAFSRSADSARAIVRVEWPVN
jgi:signal transduction histidine kinase